MKSLSWFGAGLSFGCGLILSVSIFFATVGFIFLPASVRVEEQPATTTLVEDTASGTQEKSVHSPRLSTGMSYDEIVESVGYDGALDYQPNGRYKPASQQQYTWALNDGRLLHCSLENDQLTSWSFE